MLTRKNIGPLHCASCDKNLTNILGKPVDFSAHKKMPLRESTNDRIARYGQGFSKMLSTILPPDSLMRNNAGSVSHLGS